MTKARAIKLAAVLVGLALLGAGLYREAVRPASFDAQPPGIMNTQTHLTVTARTMDAALAREALGRAEQELRDLELKMSVTIPLSELSRLNRAKVGEPVPLSPQVLEVLRAARTLTQQTRNTFDPTCGPLFDLWKQAGLRKRAPTREEVKQALDHCGWKHWAIEEEGARRLDEGAAIGLGGIGKGYAVDRAVDVLRGPGIVSGLVDLGGHIRFFGRPPGGGPWRIDVRDPFDADKALCTLTMTAGGVCTSGNYERYIEIDGRRFNHVVDPRTGWPADLVPSATVVAPAAITCEGWTKCLSVLGPEGLRLIGPGTGIDALVIVGGARDWTWYATDGFEKLLVEPLPPARKGALPPASRPAGGDTGDAGGDTGPAGLYSQRPIAERPE